MNIQSPKIKIALLTIIVIAYAIVLWGNKEINKLVDSLSIQILAILVGLIIGAIAVLMALFGNLINGVISSIDKNDNIDREAVQRWITGCNAMINEIKQDVIFLIIALFMCALFSFLKNVDVPRIIWPFCSAYFNKELVINWISLILLGFSFVAIIDVVNTMFIINKHNEILLLSKIGQSESHKFYIAD